MKITATLCQRRNERMLVLSDMVAAIALNILVLFRFRFRSRFGNGFRNGFRNRDRLVSEKAISRGISQLGTLGSGNHYLEIQVATPDKIFDKDVAKAFGIFDDQILVMIHCGSRGFGHQVATDYLKIFDTAMRKYGITVGDRELACAPFNSPEGQDYYKAMACAANVAFANRQAIVHRVREGFSEVFGREPEELGMDIIYDVAHNVAKIETHEVDGEEKELLIHRKGSTRCFGPGRKEIPEIYRKIGQPVIVGGSMETGSYLLVGTEKAMKETFGSTMHGSGPGFAYKDISEVVDTMEMAGISRKVVGLRPIGNIKG